MERRLAKKFETHNVLFKYKIREWFETNNSRIEGGSDTSEFLKFVYDFDGISLNKEDFLKRKRVKNVVAQCERCIAKRANGDQCTRRKKGVDMYCGTHTKGRPHGLMDVKESDGTVKLTKREIWAEEIKGIYYYIDSMNNVYKAEEVMNNMEFPSIIAQYKVTESGVYTIPEFEI